jgi:toxin ParE1/3/4
LRVIWSPLAIERACEEALDGLFESTDRLQRFPLAGRVVPEIEHPDYREIIHGKHRVIYRIEKRRVSILTVCRSKD